MPETNESGVSFCERVAYTVDMNKDEFDKMFDYMRGRFDDMDKRFDKQDEKIADLTIAIADLGAQLRDYHQEMLALSHKVDRLERWIHEIAEKTGVTLSYDA